MNILIVGDSLTEGKLGQNYLDYIAAARPDLHLTNLGLGGDTLRGIKDRTLAHLEKHTSYDVIIIVAGHNDIIIPAFEKETLIHKQIARSLRNRGSIPSVTPEAFKKVYKGFLAALKRLTKATLIISTLSCLNELLSAETNQQRAAYNQVIRDISTEQSILLCDVGKAFDAYLADKDTKDFFMESLTRAFIFDQYKTKTPEDTLALSTQRGLHLTIDGVHLNARGAQLYAKALLDLI